MKNSIFIALLVCALQIATCANAIATEPAVAGINGKAGVTFGSVDDDNLFVADGSITFPLNPATGLQLDAGFGEWDSAAIGDTDITRLGFHLFARDPQLGLAGIYASMNELETSFGDADIDQYGIEGEFYSGPLTFSALLGQNRGDIDDDFLGTLDVKWYPMDELMFEIGAAIVESDSKAHVGAEYQLLESLASYTDLAISAYADLAVGDDSYDHALIGLKTYFGSPKSLTERHRKDTVNNTTDKLNPPLLQ